jgi:hypothetical protein
MTFQDETSDGKKDSTEATLSDALASLSLTTEIDSALLSYLNLLDKYMFHMECLSQHFRMVSPGILHIKTGILRFGPSE